MPRVKGGVTTRRRHNKVLEITKGHRGSSHLLFRRAHESMLHALSYSYRHRKERKAQFRQLWIARINAAARIEGLSYSRFMDGLKKAGVEMDRKVLADIALKDSSAFAKLAGLAKGTQ